MPWPAKRTPADASPAPEKVATDASIDSYVRWLATCQHVRRAYRNWLASAPAHRRHAFSRYLAALDQEEHAAGIHSFWTERVRALES